MKKKRLVFNSKSMAIYTTLVAIAIVLGVVDVENSVLFVITKLVSGTILLLLLLLSKFLPNKYL